MFIFDFFTLQKDGMFCSSALTDMSSHHGSADCLSACVLYSVPVCECRWSISNASCKSAHHSILFYSYAIFLHCLIWGWKILFNANDFPHSINRLRVLIFRSLSRVTRWFDINNTSCTSVLYRTNQLVLLLVMIPNSVWYSAVLVLMPKRTRLANKVSLTYSFGESMLLLGRLVFNVDAPSIYIPVHNTGLSNSLNNNNIKNIYSI